MIFAGAKANTADKQVPSPLAAKTELCFPYKLEMLDWFSLDVGPNRIDVMSVTK